MKINQKTSNPSNKPHPAIGFTAIYSGTDQDHSKSLTALQRALAHFDDLAYQSIKIGNTHLTIWGRGDLKNCIYPLSDGSLLILIGSPSGNFTWEDISNQVLAESTSQPLILPWEGRVILLRINEQGESWSIWNDWIGSIPVFHTQLPSSRIASTLEPVVVDVANYGSEDIFLPGLLALMMWGHYLGNWSLFKNMEVIPPDCKGIWEDSNFSYTQYHSVELTDKRWEYGWSELIDEMHELFHKAIASSLDQHTQWILPLSSGLDSRLIAGVAAELGANVHTYTWGNKRSSDVINAKNIARSLDLPWKHIDLGDTFLSDYRHIWANLFGSAMHFHGMYQMPFLDALKNEPSGPILSGFLGDALGGYGVRINAEAYQGPYPYQLATDGYLNWTPKELHKIMSIPIEEALQELIAEVNKLLTSKPGALFQRYRFAMVWGRQRHFTYFQTNMSNFWRGVSTPFVSRECARFSYSLPRAVLDDRMLEQVMLRHYYPKLAAIPGSYNKEPALLTGSYLLKKRISNYLPNSQAGKIFPGIHRTRSAFDVECVKRDKEQSFIPLFGNINLLNEWINTDVIEKTYEEIFSKNSMQAVRKLQSIQTLAYRLSGLS